MARSSILYSPRRLPRSNSDATSKGTCAEGGVTTFLRMGPARSPSPRSRNTIAPTPLSVRSDIRSFGRCAHYDASNATAGLAQNKQTDFDLSTFLQPLSPASFMGNSITQERSPSSIITSRICDREQSPSWVHQGESGIGNSIVCPNLDTLSAKARLAQPNRISASPPPILRSARFATPVNRHGSLDSLATFDIGFGSPTATYRGHGPPTSDMSLSFVQGIENSIGGAQLRENKYTPQSFTFRPGNESSNMCSHNDAFSPRAGVAPNAQMQYIRRASIPSIDSKIRESEDMPSLIPNRRRQQLRFCPGMETSFTFKKNNAQTPSSSSVVSVVGIIRDCPESFRKDDAQAPPSVAMPRDLSPSLRRTFPTSTVGASRAEALQSRSTPPLRSLRQAHNDHFEDRNPIVGTYPKELVAKAESAQARLCAQRERPTSKEHVLAPSMPKSGNNSASPTSCVERDEDEYNTFEQSCPSLAQQCAVKLIVFDFDCTLTSFHVFSSLAGVVDCSRLTLPIPAPHARTEQGQLQRLNELEVDASWGPSTFALKAFGGPIRLEQIRRLLETLHCSGVECMILSRGMVQTIRTCLAQVNLLSFFSRICGSEGCSLGATAYDFLVAESDVDQGIDHLGTRDIDVQFPTECKADKLRRLLEERSLQFGEILYVDDELGEIDRARCLCRTMHVSSGSGMELQDMDHLCTLLE